MFTLSNCEMMAIYIAHVYYSLPEKHRGYIICLEQKLFGAPLVWYYRNALPDTFILEFNRRYFLKFSSTTLFVVKLFVANTARQFFFGLNTWCIH